MTTIRCLTALLAGVALAGAAGCSESNPASPTVEMRTVDGQGKSMDRLTTASYVRYECFDCGELVPGHNVVVTLYGKPTNDGYIINVDVYNVGGTLVWNETWSGQGNIPASPYSELNQEIRGDLDSDNDGIWDWQDARPYNPDPDNPDDDDCGDRQT